MLKRKILACLLCLITILSLYACKPAEPSSTSNPSESISIPERDPQPINPLTGCEGLSEAAVGKRPVAVMINNITQALPQYGVAAADIMVETVVEGGITRMLAIYGDYTQIPDVCSIRSARYYYPVIAASFDAIYVHWGSENQYAPAKMRDLGIDRLSGEANTGGIFARDAQRRETYAYEHCGYMKGAEVPAAVEGANIRSDLAEGFTSTVFNFNAETAPVTPSDGTHGIVTLNFSKSYYSTFVYDAQTKTYLKYHNGSAHMDGRADTQLAYTNVFVLETTITTLEGELMKVGLTGGEGYYISDGGYRQIKWSKAGETAPFVFTDLQGNPLTVNAGKSYIGLIGAERTLLESDPSGIK